MGQFVQLVVVHVFEGLLQLLGVDPVQSLLDFWRVVTQHFAKLPRGRYHGHRVTQDTGKARGLQEHIHNFFPCQARIFYDLGTNSFDFRLHFGTTLQHLDGVRRPAGHNGRAILGDALGHVFDVTLLLFCQVFHGNHYTTTARAAPGACGVRFFTQNFCKIFEDCACGGSLPPPYCERSPRFDRTLIPS